MKTIFVAALVLVFICALVSAQNKSDPDAKAVLKLCNDWDDAYIKKDARPLEKLLAADFVGIDEDGAVTSKADEISLIRTDEYVIFSVEYLEPPKVRFYGST